MVLIIDGNAFLNVCISITKSITSNEKRIGEKYYIEDLLNENSYILKESVRITFRNFCFNYLSSLFSIIGNSLDSVNIVFDSMSWRKEYIKRFFNIKEFKTEASPSKFDYKGKRKYDEFNYLFFEYFSNIIIPVLQKEVGINFYKFKGIEGEDIIAYLCNIINKDILIYSVDKDLIQLVSNKNKNIILITPKQMSRSKKVYVPLNLYKKSFNEDFFSLDEDQILGSDFEKILNSLKNKEYQEIKIDSVKELINKILGGDKSDNISKIYKITPKKIEFIYSKLYEKFGDQILHKIDTLNEEFIDFILNIISQINKINDKDKLNEIREHLIFNIKIIRLSENMLPDDLRNDLLKFFSNFNESYLKFNYKNFYNLKNNLSIL